MLKFKCKTPVPKVNVDERTVLTELKEMLLEGVERIHLAPLLDQWRAIVNTVIKLGEILASPKWISSMK